MKYKVGDKVKVRSWTDMEQEFGLYSDGIIKISDNNIFTKLMRQWCNKVVTIEMVYLNYYTIKEDGWYWNWTDKMIDHRATKIMSIIDRLEKLKKLMSSKFIKTKINFDIENLKSDNPEFTSYDVNYYNNIFRKIKGKK